MRLFRVVLAILFLLTLLIPIGADFPVGAAETERCFPETGFCASDLFLDYWLKNGGLEQQGYPISPVFEEVSPTNGQTFKVQYFERARFESHFTPSGNFVLLGLLGREQFQAKYPIGRPAGGAGDSCFAETARCVSARFYSYWMSHGGLAQQGYPLSDEFEEKNPTNGKTYRVQYFERARFEYHPENAGTPYEVLLGLIGREQFMAKYPSGITPTGTPSLPPDPAYYQEFIRVNQLRPTRTLEADVTGDGIPEYLLIAIPDPCGSCRNYRVVIFSGRIIRFDETFLLLADLEISPDHRGFRITQAVARPGEGLCCATGRRFTTYGWNGSAFVVMAQEER